MPETWCPYIKAFPATTMLANNTPVPVITGVLGHASSRTTQKYLSIDVDGLRKVSLEVPE